MTTKAEELARDFFTINPNYATQERLREYFEQYGRLVQEAAAERCIQEAEHPANSASPNLRLGCRACSSAIREMPLP